MINCYDVNINRKEPSVMIDIFDIMGPIMVGPSSSHTAGAVRIGRMALTLLITQAYGANANLPGMQTAIGKQVDVLLSPWYRTMVKYDPEADIRAVRKPWLAINGERDTQVLPANLATIRELNPTAETVELPAHNHLLQPCITGLVNEYATLPAAPSSDALALILRWLTATPLPHP